MQGYCITLPHWWKSFPSEGNFYIDYFTCRKLHVFVVGLAEASTDPGEDLGLATQHGLSYTDAIIVRINFPAAVTVEVTNILPTLQQ